MSRPASDPASPWQSALTAAALLAVDPIGIAGVVLRARHGPLRDRWLEVLRAAPTSEMRITRLPCEMGDDRLLGGLDLAATLAAGRPIAERGALAAADDSIVLLAMAERVGPGLAARLAATLDTGSVAVERDGLAYRVATRFGVVALDEGAEPHERPPPALTDRLGIHIDLTALEAFRGASDTPAGVDRERIAEARARLAGVEASDDVVEALCAAAMSLGVTSLRAPLLALRVARASAALAGRDCVEQADAVLAAQLVLAPRATRAPADTADGDTEEEQSAKPEPPPPMESDDDPVPDDAADGGDAGLSEIVVAAARAAVPPDLLACGALGEPRASPSGQSGRSGHVRQKGQRGRQIGVHAGGSRRAGKLDLTATLRAAAPWQRLRRKELANARQSERAHTAQRILVRAQDFRYARFKQRSETLTIFAVDASGSSALNRLAEAKGAVEVLLSECYVRRDQVALIAFGRRGAEVLLQPTRALARAKRSLSALPGGGGTPLASGLDAASRLAATATRNGQTPLVVVLTDGRANIGRDGKPGRVKAEADALAAGTAMSAAGIAALMLDISLSPAPLARQLAHAMRARYLHLPQADARTISSAIERANADWRAAERTS